MCSAPQRVLGFAQNQRIVTPKDIFNMNFKAILRSSIIRGCYPFRNPVKWNSLRHWRVICTTQKISTKRKKGTLKPRPRGSSLRCSFSRAGYNFQQKLSNQETQNGSRKKEWQIAAAGYYCQKVQHFPVKSVSFGWSSFH